MIRQVRPVNLINGEIDVPADKSIAHRAALISALADGTSGIVNYPDAKDPQSTLACLRQLGIKVRQGPEDIIMIEGKGPEGLREADGPIDCGNSGTTMRLLAGMLAGCPFDSTLIGDDSLNRRPMTRIATPLREMGARISLVDEHPPVTIHAGGPLRGIIYRLPVASAQVKSCILLAGLLADGETTVIESLASRDHTERMLGLTSLEFDGERHLTVTKGHTIKARTWTVPGDFSAAAFFLVAGSILPDSRLILKGVGLNPTRADLLNVLRGMGADITLENERSKGGEPIADLTVRSAELYGVHVSGSRIPVLIDEIPILAVAAAYAEGRTVVRDAAELRVKETDRIAAMTINLRKMGVEIEEFEDGFSVLGGRKPTGAEVDSFGDHRIAMAMAVAALGAKGETTIRTAECVGVSFPGFWDALDRVTH